MPCLKYYKHKICEYAMQTKFMTFEQKGLYVDMRDVYYTTGKPLDGQWVSMFKRAAGDDLVESVLSLCFVKDGDVYRCEEFDTVIAEYEAMAEKNRGNASKKTRVTSQKKRVESDSEASGNRVGCEEGAVSCATGEPLGSQLINKETNKEVVVPTTSTASTDAGKKRSPILPIPLDPEPEWIEAAKEIRQDVDPFFVWRKMRDYYRAEKKAMTTWRRLLISWVGREHGQINRTTTSINQVTSEMTDDDVPDFDPRTRHGFA